MAILIISSLLILVLLGVRTDESNLFCIRSVRVQRNTGWSARVTERLMINCTVQSNCKDNITVKWCKIDMKNQCIHLNHSNHTSTEWRTISEWERLFFLIFWNISLQDSGLYNCEILTPVHTMGHVINVTVTDYNAVSTETITEGSPVTPVTDITNTHLSSEKWLYVIYFSAFVVALILAVPLMCRGYHDNCDL
ncbi:uncharacterized protein LOC113634778 isoform X2 [Tachysurus fulvidraco]|uniref:uncharacterized protein LOC113634778 isoform X2 n=1 Tax=Tachysurus fulvidraco TaxID=1234273 RepID=UPI001FEF8741|nr:uncharacterized protein LOC113634778 isoform X2 [Tachysurus fulvidraco]